MADMEAFAQRLAALETRVGLLEKQILPAIQQIGEQLSLMRTTLEAHMVADQHTMREWAAAVKAINAKLAARSDA